MPFGSGSSHKPLLPVSLTGAACAPGSLSKRTLWAFEYCENVRCASPAAGEHKRQPFGYPAIEIRTAAVCVRSESFEASELRVWTSFRISAELLNSVHKRRTRPSDSPLLCKGLPLVTETMATSYILFSVFFSSVLCLPRVFESFQFSRALLRTILCKNHC